MPEIRGRFGKSLWQTTIEVQWYIKENSFHDMREVSIVILLLIELLTSIVR